MKKHKGPRIVITLECITCIENQKILGVSRYLTTKNRRNTPKKLELLKYCCFCKKHTNFKEIK